MDIKTLLPHIITAVVSLVSIIATSAVSITLSKSNHKRELARLEYDYRLKHIDSSMQVKRDSYRDVYRLMAKTRDLVYDLSREAHKPVEEPRYEYRNRNDNQVKELKEIWSMFQQQKSDAYFVSSWLCDYYFTQWHVTLNRIVMLSCEDGYPIEFFRSEDSKHLLDALLFLENDFLEQARKELGFSKNDDEEIIKINSLNNESAGCLLKKTNGEIVLLAGAKTEEPQTDSFFDFWADEYGYVLPHSKTFKNIEEAAKYLMGNDEKYEIKQICKL